MEGFDEVVLGLVCSEGEEFLGEVCDFLLCFGSVVLDVGFGSDLEGLGEGLEGFLLFWGEGLVE